MKSKYIKTGRPAAYFIRPVPNVKVNAYPIIIVPIETNK